MVSRPAGGLRGAVSAPAGYGAVPRGKKYVSKYFHGFFITINSMILYFKHIIHIENDNNVCQDRARARNLFSYQCSGHGPF